LDLAARGHAVLGIDASSTAITRARAKARERGSAAEFVVADALELERLGRTFDTAIDSGLYHVFTDDERERYVAGLAAVLRPGGRLYLLCFSEEEPGDWGPRRITQRELRESFGAGWRVLSIEPARFET